MNVDLHCHTNVSDGALTPEALIDLAIEREIDMLSITDHDTLAAYQAIEKTPTSLRIIPGIEFSSQWRKSGVHIVGLNLDMTSDAILQGVTQQSRARSERGEKIAEKLQRLGFDNCLEGALSYTAGGQVGRPHFAQHLVAIGAVANIAQAFKKYLGAGKAGDIKEQWADIPTVVGWIKDSGGVAVLAHPLKYKLTRTKLVAMLDDFFEAGGEGMEVISGMQAPNITKDLGVLCNKNGLLASCGSDFHSSGQPWAALGKVAQLPESCTPVWSRWS